MSEEYPLGAKWTGPVIRVGTVHSPFSEATGTPVQNFAARIQAKTWISRSLNQVNPPSPRPLVFLNSTLKFQGNR